MKDPSRQNCTRFKLCYLHLLQRNDDYPYPGPARKGASMRSLRSTRRGARSWQSSSPTAGTGIHARITPYTLCKPLFHSAAFERSLPILLLSRRHHDAPALSLAATCGADRSSIYLWLGTTQLAEYITA
jgi:hypothetical protein